LFRAVAHGACLRSGKPAPDESTQRTMADELRNKAIDELVKRRETTEWYVFNLISPMAMLCNSIFIHIYIYIHIYINLLVSFVACNC
jgi:hypothetical protein